MVLALVTRAREPDRYRRIGQYELTEGAAA
jgi:hypothetical protein